MNNNLNKNPQENQTNFLQDEKFWKKHRRNVIIARVIGLCMLVAGITLAIIGVVFFYNRSKVSMICMTIGFPLAAFGGFITIVSFAQKINQFTIAQTANVQKDYTNYMYSNTKENVGQVADRIIEGKQIDCPKCGFKNDNDAKFCKKFVQIVML